MLCLTPRRKLNTDAVAEAITAILKQSQEKKRGFVETIELQFALKNYDPNKDKRFSGSLRLPIAPKQKFKVDLVPCISVHRAV